jgi:hypothetical protein
LHGLVELCWLVEVDVKYWDLRQSTAIASVECQERVYTMDVKNKLLVIGLLAGRG